jgi:ABC-type oligopeptide transport system ATPase subunit
MENLLKLENVSKTFKTFDSAFKKSKVTVHAVDNITLSIKRGSSIGIVGESGSGKTTIAKLITGIHRPDSGHIFYKNELLDNASKNTYNDFRKNIQMIFQDPYSSLNPKLTIFSTLKDGIKKHITTNKKEIFKKCSDILKTVGLEEEHLKRYPHQFSGGQMQRISIARALSIEPEMIVADEPVSSLDVSIQAQILNLLKKLRKDNGTTLLMIAHDLAIVNFLCDETLVMYKGNTMEYGQTKEILQNPLHPYTKNLIEASIKKDIKKITTGKTGRCPYADRCNFVMDICTREVYKYQVSKTHHVYCNLYK